MPISYHMFNSALRLITPFTLVCAISLCQSASTSEQKLPAVFSPAELSYDPTGKLVLTKHGAQLPDLGNTDQYTLTQMLGNPSGAGTGIQLDFGLPTLDGTVAYGPYVDDAKYPTISFLPKPVQLKNGRALLEIKKVFVYTNDFFNFSEKGQGIIGFRVIDKTGRMLYEGRVAFRGKGPYKVLPTIIEGPLVNLLTPSGCTLSFETQVPIAAEVSIDGRKFGDPMPVTHHEIQITGLQPASEYKYSVQYGDLATSRIFRTALREGSREPFTFAFISNNRATSGGGLNDLGAVNYATARAAMAAAVLNNSAFMQTMGGNTTGNDTSMGGHLLEHANWKRAYEPFWSHIPLYAGMGNHEANYFVMAEDPATHKTIRIERFPYETQSGVAAFAQAFTNPMNGPESEDGASYDPDPNQQDFPSYKENVYSYTYGNVAMIVLNSEYWKSSDSAISGAPEGYVMDQQLKWLEETIAKFERDPNIDHTFINLHSSVFPNGNHSDAGMWYLGSNAPRPRVAGKLVGNGIIERRDQLIDACANQSKKCVGFLAGSEHNFAFLKVTPDLPIYPKVYSLPKLKIKRSIYYVNNGGGGVYSYALVKNTPWVDHFQFFTVPPSLSLFKVNGKHVSMSTFNPETFEKICDVDLR